MCGRFSQYNLAKALVKEWESKKYFTKLDLSLLPNRFNITPTQNILVLKKGNSGFEVVSQKWGLIPFWSKDSSIGSKMINARAETITEKPSFKNSFKKQRCLIPANGFYEWKKEGRTKQPYYIKPKEQELFYFAGLWDVWKSNEAEIQTCTIITTEANDLLKPIHDKNRMPVILGEKQQALWLDADSKIQELVSLLKPYPDAKMIAYPVQNYVNRSGYDTQECIQEMIL
ncbi:MAG: SOS response-associated peptidase [Leptospiraceae bacterium]|nr:SOS response-associated peptidase [Leptospiraceae bacterium]